VFIDQDSFAGGSNVLSIAFLLRHPDIEVVGIGVIGGDSSIDDAVYATLQTVEACESKAPVARGAGDPFLNSRQAVFSRMTLWGPKGGDGWLGEWGPRAVPRGSVREIPGVPPPSTKAHPDHAALLLIEMARKYAGELVLFTAGPLTNIALAVSIAPDIVDKIAAVYTMASAINVRSKFNFWWDPESAAVFLRQAWRKKVLVPIDVCEQTLRFSRPLLAKVLPTAEGPFRTWLVQMFAQTWAEFGLPMWDELTAAILLDPAVLTASQNLYIGVDHTWGPNYGATLVLNGSREEYTGLMGVSWGGSVTPWQVVMGADRDRFETLFINTFRGAGKHEL
jgi:inosine-uridine nucleoside N-ribohydrolase